MQPSEVLQVAEKREEVHRGLEGDLNLRSATNEKHLSCMVAIYFDKHVQLFVNLKSNFQNFTNPCFK